MLTINPSEVIWTIINFLLLLFLLRRFLFKPILGVLDKRQERIDREKAEEERLLAAISEAKEAADQQISAGRKEAERLIADGRAADQTRRDERIREAHEKAVVIRQNGDKKIVTREETEETALKESISDLTLLLAARLTVPKGA